MIDYTKDRLPLQKGIQIDAVYTAFTGNYLTGFRFDGEMHNFWEMVYVVSGSIWAAEEQQVVQLHENMFILHKPLAFHRLWCANSDAVVKIFSFDAHGDLLHSLERLAGILPWRLREPLMTTADTANMLLQCRTAKHLHSQVSAGLEYVLTELACTPTDTLPNQSQADFDRIMTTIHDCYRDNITLPQIAAMCHMSESKVKKEFRKVYDLGIMKYICKLRMRDAGRLLASGYSIDAICDILHFTDRNYFSYVFKRETGCSPREYRQKISNENNF